VLTQAFGWPAIFAVNVPLGAVVIALGLRLIPAPGDEVRGTRNFDVAGAVLITASLVSLTFGIVRTDTLGWGSSGVLVPLASGVALLVAFVLAERSASQPLVPLSILRHTQLRVANLVVALLYASFFPVWFFLTLYVQEVLGFSAIEAGLSFLPMTLSIFVASTLAPRLVGRLGPRRVITAGMLLASAGIGMLVGIAPGGSYFGAVFPGALLSAIGMGLSLVPATIVAMQSLPAEQSGVGSGLLNTSRLMGGALGLAVLSTIADAQTRADGGTHVAHALTNGFDLAFGVGAAISLLGAGLAGLRLRDPRPADLVALDPAETQAEIEEGEALAA
jgi:predicted MFS family arabinose efflux permease